MNYREQYPIRQDCARLGRFSARNPPKPARCGDPRPFPSPVWSNPEKRPNSRPGASKHSLFGFQRSLSNPAAPEARNLVQNCRIHRIHRGCEAIWLINGSPKPVRISQVFKKYSSQHVGSFELYPKPSWSTCGTNRREPV